MGLVACAHQEAFVSDDSGVGQRQDGLLQLVLTSDLGPASQKNTRASALEQVFPTESSVKLSAELNVTEQRALLLESARKLNLFLDEQVELVAIKDDAKAKEILGSSYADLIQLEKTNPTEVLLTRFFQGVRDKNTHTPLARRTLADLSYPIYVNKVLPEKQMATAFKALDTPRISIVRELERFAIRAAPNG